MQQHLMQMQPMMAAYNNITTDHIQKYLDENKQLILAILDNQNLGKLSECAQYQAKLQENLMYLAAIADSQPQPPTVHAQFSPNAAMQPGAHYLQHRQPQQMTPQAALMAARSPMLYAQQPLSALQQHQHQQQQALHSQLAMTSSAANNGLHMLHSDTTNLGGSGGAMVSGGFPDFGRGSGSSGNLGSGSGNLGSTSDAMAGGSRDRKADLVGGDMQNSDGRGASSSAQNADASEPLYLKASEEEGN